MALDGHGKEEQHGRSKGQEFTRIRCVCHELRGQIDALLAKQADHALELRVQQQCRRSLGIIKQALQRYP